MYSLGIDEVGRGCWAGPLVAGAVVLGEPLAGLADSKTLTRQRRKLLDIQIRQQSLAWGLGWVSPALIDAIGLTEAVRTAMKQALHAARSVCPVVITDIVIDGSYNFLVEESGSRTLVHADATEPAVSAASIIAKVARDTYMAGLSDQYAKYEFDRHVGYGTARHRVLLEQYGASDLHRQSFKPIQRLIVK